MAILIIDLGGQYCHLIKRTFSDLGITADIRPASTTSAEAKLYKGIILSGGPRSVYDPDSPTIDSALLDLGIPVLGICYGHQLLAKMLGGTVVPGNPEYGNSRIAILEDYSLFQGTPDIQTVWMSHGDSVTEVPAELIVRVKTAECPVVAFEHETRPLYGIQFHPEVVHTEYGAAILQNFATLCGTETDAPVDRVAQLVRHIRTTVGDRSVFFFVSGGVDSTVAFALCAKALPRDKLLAVYLDTGFMRAHEQHDLIDCFDRLGFGDRLIIKNWSQQFMAAVAGVIDPEAKRKIIGQLFIDAQQALVTELVSQDWMLGQGTIYPDIIESGGDGGDTATIKTHHNRAPAVQELIRQGRVVEPLADLYKDQVRAIGHELGIPKHFVERWPFPGPGLAIRCLCTRDMGEVEPIDDLDGTYQGLTGPYQCVRVPLRSVGVQGDARTYRTTMAVKGPLSKYDLTVLARKFHGDRIIAHLGGRIALPLGRVVPATLTRPRITILREADFVVRSAMVGHEELVWQFPVVLIPLRFSYGESIVLRPVRSRDGMTADFVILPNTVLERIVEGMLAIQGIDAVFLDVSDKPPATIEWE